MTKKVSDNLSLEERVLRFISKRSLIAPETTLVVAVSGGPDSACLLKILSEISPRLGIRLHGAHLNHRLRGEEADADAAYVAELCEKLKVPCTIASEDVTAFKHANQMTLEEAAREVRYGFLAEVARAQGAVSIVVGHTSNDHVETIMLHLLRGSGTAGLGGLKPASSRRLSGKDYSIIRPLWEISHEETEAYCQQHHLQPRHDSTNLSLSPLRNRIRLELLPKLKNYNPAITEALKRTAKIAEEDISFIKKEAVKAYRQTAAAAPQSVTLDKNKFLSLHVAIQRQVLRMAIKNVLGSLKDIEARHIEELMKNLNNQAGKKICLPQGLLFTVEYDKYLLSYDAAALSPFPPLESETALNIPGETSVSGWKVTAEIISKESYLPPEGSLTACFDLEKTSRQLTVRSRQNGDRFFPLGMNQMKKLNRFMIDKKIPQAHRGNIPLICSPEGIIWVASYRTDERFKVTSATTQVLRLIFQKTSP